MRLLFAINSSSLLSRLIILAVLFASIASAGNFRGAAQVKPSPQQIFKEIKSTAEKLAESDSAIIKPPVFRQADGSKEIEYNLGGVRVEALELPSGDPYLIPFEKQIQVEALRRLFQRELPKESFWQPLLEQLEQLVILTIFDIEGSADKSLLQRKLDLRIEQFDAELGNFHEAIRLYGQGKGYTARRVGRGLASDTFTVLVKKTPNNGRVQILPLVKYVMCSTLRKCGSNWPWRELVSESENMIGEYYYQAEWPGGQRNEGKIDIRNNTTITFSPR
jgi:hypothetical protein